MKTPAIGATFNIYGIVNGVGWIPFIVLPIDENGNLHPDYRQEDKMLLGDYLSDEWGMSDATRQVRFWSTSIILYSTKEEAIEVGRAAYEQVFGPITLTDDE